MSIRTAALSALALTAPAFLWAQTPAASPTPPAKPARIVHPRVGNETELGRKYTTWFFTAQYDSLWAHSSEDTRTEMGEASKWGEYAEQLAARAGEEVEVVSEMVMMRNGIPQYWRTSKYSMMAEPVMLRW
ncbi:MAG TPA: hypothetical protein VFV65_00535, partial [Gemmatimonadales bacterium]|nr:hypothetical protein [Gemmatimonadales bacterium]